MSKLISNSYTVEQSLQRIKELIDAKEKAEREKKLADELESNRRKAEMEGLTRTLQVAAVVDRIQLVLTATDDSPRKIQIPRDYGEAAVVAAFSDPRITKHLNIEASCTECGVWRMIDHPRERNCSKCKNCGKCDPYHDCCSGPIPH